MDAVSEASREQAQGIDQVTQAITQMEKETQTTAATAEESAAASEELSAQADTSMDVVGQLSTLVGARVSRGAPAPGTAGTTAGARAAVPGRVRMSRRPPRSPEDEIPLDATGTFGRF